MSKPLQSGDLRTLLYRNDGRELLLETVPDGLRVPAVPVPVHTRVAKEVTTAIKGLWNLDAYCLFPLSSGGPSIHYQVVEICRHDADPPAGMQWLPVASLSVSSFKDPGDLVAIQKFLTTLDQYRRGELPGVFGKPGWLRTVTEWVAEQAAAVHLCLTGKFRQLNASPTFSLIRFETDGPALWFKAAGAPNLHEYPITLKLASVFQDFVPRIVASQPEWNAWLALEFDGCPLDANSSEGAWVSVADNLALLQNFSFGGRFELIHAGCKDLRAFRLLDLVDPFLGAMAELMERQTKLTPPPLSGQELASLGREITACLKELSECTIPNTLGHLDVNPGNLLVRGTRCVFLDWAEAYVGPPFFSLQYLLEYLRKWHGADSRHEKSLVSAYATNWTRFASPSEIAAIFRVAPLLAAFTHAAGSINWKNRESIGSQTARYLRSLTRRMKQEADALQHRRFTCVP